MDEYLLAIKPLEPLRIGGVKSKTSYLDTLNYIPGSILRGTLAEWLKVHGQTNSILSTIRQVRFGNFFPSEESAVSLPFPITTLECKIKPGFKKVPREKLKECGHGIRDTLLISLVYTELERHAKRKQKNVGFPVPLLLRCTAQENGKKCGSRMDRVGGFYTQLPEGWVKNVPEKWLQTKVALSRYRRAAQEGKLYHVVAIRPKGVFVGRVWAENHRVIEQLKEATSELGIGGLATRGFGRAELKELDLQFPSVQERLREFNRTLHGVWGDLVNLAEQAGFSLAHEPEGTYFTVDLLSPAILIDPDTGMPTLKLQLTLDGETLKPVWWATRPTFVGGFSTAWGLYKPTALGAAMGSVYVFKTDLPEKILVKELEALEAQGVGERTDEGLGEVIVSHPFHKEVMPV